jgi:hypothetical protein
VPSIIYGLARDVTIVIADHRPGSRRRQVRHDDAYVVGVLAAANRYG